MSDCSVDSCEKARYQGHRMCSTHVMRLHRYGDLHADHTPKPKPVTFHSNGYRLLPRRGHPLADSSGYVYEHRLVLYAVLGPGAHPCHWCKRHVEWSVDLEVDHLDDDKTNNTPANLAPSCHACNTGRAGRQRWERWRSTHRARPSTTPLETADEANER